MKIAIELRLRDQDTAIAERLKEQDTKFDQVSITLIDLIAAIKDLKTTPITAPTPRPSYTPAPTIPQLVEPRPSITMPIPSPSLAPIPNTTLNRSLIKEASKKVYIFPKSYKLVGPSNYDQ